MTEEERPALTAEKLKEVYDAIADDPRWVPPCGSKENPHLAASDGPFCIRCGYRLGWVQT